MVDKFLGFAQNSVGKQQAANCCFSKEFCENPGNGTTNRKKELKFQIE
jgi:hypothetical protein